MGGGLGRVCGGDHGGCERRIEVFVKIQKSKFWEGGGSARVWVGGWGWVGGGGVGLGVRVDVNEELKFLGKFTQK